MSKSPGGPSEPFIKLFIYSNLAFWFLISPVLVGIWLWLNRDLSGFLGNFVWAMGIVYVTGGFAVLGIKIWEVLDNKFILFKRGKRRQKDPLLKNVFYKVCIPQGHKLSAVDMMPFFYDMLPLNHVRTPYEKYVEGKWYYNINFDFLVRRGKTELYLSFPKKREDVIMKSLRHNFKKIKFVKTEDPYKNWPKKWVPGKTKIGPYKDFHATDFALANEGPLFPLQFPERLPIANPLGDLLQAFSEFDPEAMYIVQYVVRPFLDNPKADSQTKRLTELKRKILQEDATFEFTDTKGKSSTRVGEALVSDKQRKLINDCQTAMGEGNFKVHMKLMVFYPPGKSWYGNTADKLMKGFFGQLAGENQIVEKDWFTATDRFFLNSPIGLDSLIGPIMNTLYHSKEIVYRAKLQYEALFERDPDIAHDSTDFMLDTKSLSSLIHFPDHEVFPGCFEEATKSSPAGQAEQSSVDSEAGQPAQAVEAEASPKPAKPQSQAVAAKSAAGAFSDKAAQTQVQPSASESKASAASGANPSPTQDMPSSSNLQDQTSSGQANSESKSVPVSLRELRRRRQQAFSSQPATDSNSQANNSQPSSPEQNAEGRFNTSTPGQGGIRNV